MGNSMDSGPCPTCGGSSVNLIQSPTMDGYFYQCSFCRTNFGSTSSARNNMSFNPGQASSVRDSSTHFYPPRASRGSAYEGSPSSGVYGSDPSNPDRMIAVVVALYRLLKFLLRVIRKALLTFYIKYKNQKNDLG